MVTSSNNPYAIRASLLQEARQHLMEQWHGRRMDAEYNSRVLIDSKSSSSLAGMFLSTEPAPSVEDIIALAEKFKAFVDNP